MNKNKIAEKLLFEIAQGNKSAMGELYELIKTDVYAFALSKTKNRFEAEDVMHDTFIRIYKYAKQYIPQGRPFAWIFTIEINIIRRMGQIKGRQVCYEQEFINLASPTAFEQTVIEDEFLTQIMNLLSEEERSIITLHIVTGLKHREISQILQIPLSTVLSKYNRAIKKLQKAVKEVPNE